MGDGEAATSGYQFMVVPSRLVRLGNRRVEDRGSRIEESFENEEPDDKARLKGERDCCPGGCSPGRRFETGRSSAIWPRRLVSSTAKRRRSCQSLAGEDVITGGQVGARRAAHEKGLWTKSSLGATGVRKEKRCQGRLRVRWGQRINAFFGLRIIQTSSYGMRRTKQRAREPRTGNERTKRRRQARNVRQQIPQQRAMIGRKGSGSPGDAAPRGVCVCCRRRRVYGPFSAAGQLKRRRREV